MTEQNIVAFISRNWNELIWTVSTIMTVAGLIIYNAKIVLPGFVTRMDNMEKDIKELQDDADEEGGYITSDDCRRNHKEFDVENKKEHALIMKEIDKILKCVETSENMRQRAKVHQISFMTAVKEKLDLEFKVPTG